MWWLLVAVGIVLRVVDGENDEDAGRIAMKPLIKLIAAEGR